MSNTLRGAIYGLTAAAIWGGMYVVSDLVLPIIPPFTLLTIRLLLGIATLGLIMWRTRAQFPNRRGVLKILTVGFLGFGISVGAQFVGTDLSNAINGALVTSASPAFILLFAVLVLGERLKLRNVIAVVLATIGVLVIIDLAQADFSSAKFTGNVALTVAAVTWGLYSVLVRRVSAQLDTLGITLIAFCGGLLLTIPAAVLELPQRPIGDINAAVMLGIVYLGIVSTAGAMWLWNRAFALVDASVASLFFFAQPLVGALLGAVIGQEITVSLLIGGGLIAMGLLVSLYNPNRLKEKLA